MNYLTIAGIVIILFSLLILVIAFWPTKKSTWKFLTRDWDD